MKTYVVTPHKNRLEETVLMMGHNLCFFGEICPIIPELSLLPLLIWSTVGPNFERLCLIGKQTVCHYTCIWPLGKMAKKWRCVFSLKPKKSMEWSDLHTIMFGSLSAESVSSLDNHQILERDKHLLKKIINKINNNLVNICMKVLQCFFYPHAYFF